MTIDLTNVSKCLDACACVRALVFVYKCIVRAQGVSGMSGYENPILQ